MKLNICFATMMLAVNIANATTMDITEVSIGDFSEFVSATGLITSAEKKVVWYMKEDGLRKVIGIGVNPMV